MQNFNMTEYLKHAVELEKTVYVQEHTIRKLDSKIKSLCVRKKLDLPNERELETDNGGTILYLGSALVGIGLGFLFLHWSNGCSLSCTRTFAKVISILPFIFGATMLILGLSALLTARKDRQRLRSEYETKLVSATRAKMADDERIEKEKAIKENLSSQRTALYNKYKESKDILNRLYSLDIIYPKYRNLVSVCSFYEYFMSGRCTALEGHEGAYNIFENEIRLNAIITRLDDVIAHLDQIEQNQYLLHSAIVEGNRKIDNLVKTSEQIASKLDYIAEQSTITAKNSALTAENAAWAAQEANTIKWIEIIRS